MKRLALPPFIAVLVFVSAADATRIVSDSPEYRQWTNAALVPTPRGKVKVHDDLCRIGPYATAGCSKGRVIYSVLRGGPLLFFHELGHVFDRTEMSKWDRKQYTRIYGLPFRWKKGPFSLSERFAEDYAACAWSTCPLEVRRVIERAYRRPNRAKRCGKTQHRKHRR